MQGAEINWKKKNFNIFREIKISMKQNIWLQKEQEQESFLKEG